MLTPLFDTAESLPPAPAKPLRKHFAWMLCGNLIYGACQWGMLVAIAKLGSAEMVGQFALGLAISAPVFMFTNLQLRAVQATDAQRRYRFGHYLALRVAGTSAALITIAAILRLANYKRETTLVVLTMALAKAAECISDIFYGLWQNRERFDRIAIAMIGRGVASLTALVAVLHCTAQVLYAVAAIAAVWGGWMLTWERGTSRRLLSGVPGESMRALWDAARLKQLTLLAAPLGAVMLFVSLNMNIPRYFIEHHLGEAALGYFSAMAHIVVAGIMVVTALGQTASPRLARYYLEDRIAFRRLLVKMLALAVILGVVGVLAAAVAGRPVLMLLYRSDYAHYAGVFTWLMVAGASMYVGSVLGYAMTAAWRFSAQIPVYGMTAIVIGAAARHLVPRYELLGAAWVMLAGGVVPLLGAAVVVLRAFRAPARKFEP